MKNFILLLFTFLFSFLGYSQMANESFEAAIFPPTDWLVFDNGVSGTPNANWSTNATANSGVKAAFMNRQPVMPAGSISQDFLATPSINIPTNGQIKFFTRVLLSGVQAGTVYKVMVKPVSVGAQGDPSGYEILQQWDDNTPLVATFNVYEEKTINVTNPAYLGVPVYVAFMMEHTSNGQVGVGNRWLVDDAKVVAQCLPPNISSLTAGPIFATSATLGWASTIGTTSYEIENMPATASPSGFATSTSTTNSFVQTGLTGVTAYKFYVRANCGGGNFSAWVGPYSYTTTVAPPECGGNFVDSGLTNGNYGNNENITTTIQPGLNTDKVTVNFTSFNTDLGDDILRVYDGCTATASNLIGTYSGTVSPGSITATNVDGCLTFVFTSDGFGTQSGWTSGITCGPPPSCQKPVSVQLNAVLSTTATLNWGAIANAVSYQVLYQTCGSPAPTLATIGWTPASSNTLAITGLSPNTCYDFYVRAVCPSNDLSLWSNPVSATTQVLPPVCGGNYVDSGGTTASYSSGEDNIITICPDPATTNFLVTVTFTAFDTEANWDGLYVFDGNEITDPLIPSINGGANVPGGVPGSYWGTTIPGPFTSTSADGCLTFRFRSDTSVVRAGWNANITCNPAPTCRQPILLTATNVTENSAQLAWTSPGTAASWQVLVLPTGSVAPTAATTGWTSATSPFVFPNLTPNTTYDFYVRGDCGSVDGLSLWSGPVTFTTLATCLPPTITPQSTVTTTATTATITWTNVGIAANWQILALPCGAPVPTSAATGWSAVSSNPAIISNLTPATCYDFYVRGVCSTTDFSVWVGPQSANTQILPPVCGGNYVDSGGLNGQYSGGEDRIVTICPDAANPNFLVTVTFNAFDTEANWDGMYVFDGPNINATQISSLNGAANVPGGLAGSYWGTAIPGPFTSSDPTGCLTFRFRSDGSINRDGWNAGVTCAPPPTCRKPALLTAIAVTQTGVTIGWTQAANPDNSVANAWEYLILPANSPVPTATATGWISTSSSTNNVVTNLTSATCYDYYVRAVCSSTDSSTWAGPRSFCTLIENDECANATIAPVNPDANCAQVAAGSLIGSTPSTQTNTCAGGQTNDVWYSFTATTTNHYVEIKDVVGNAFNLNFAIYSGVDCNTLTEINCTNGLQGIEGGLTVGQTYYVRVFTDTFVTTNNFTFNLCIGTIPPPISTNTTQYTEQQLVVDVLLNSTCATVSNITFATETNGIGYFDQNGSNFPFANGVILSTGNAANAFGPNNTTLSDGGGGTSADADLEAIVLDATGDPMNSKNTTKLEFDFTPITNEISFDFIFASEEYGQFQCTYSDAFAFLLTNLATGVTTNLAIVPMTTTPISVVTVRNDAFNAGCASVNSQYFGQYNQQPPAAGVSALSSPTNFNGQTVPLTATSPVTINQPYHIKLVIADRLDTLLDSAVFLKGSSFGIGNLNLGSNLLQSTGNALCFGTSRVINTGLDPAFYSFEWKKDGVILPFTTPTITVTEAGTYSVHVTYIGSNCVGDDSVIVEYYPDLNITSPNNLVICSTTGSGVFNLTQNTPVVLTQLTPASDYNVNYYTTQTDAINNTNPIANTNAYTNVSNPQTIFVRIQNIATNCFKTSSFTLNIQNNPPQFTVPATIEFCDGSSDNIAVIPINFILANATYSWTKDAVLLTNTTSTISISDAGVYQVTVNVGGCTSSQSTIVSLNVLDTTQVTFNYNPNVTCNDGSNQLPTFVVTGSGSGAGAGTQRTGVFSAVPSGLVFVSNTTGEINVQASLPNIYTITYTINAIAGDCYAGQAPTTTFTINPMVSQDATVSYTSPVCIADGNIAPTVTTIGGTFSGGPGMVINPNTGEITISNQTTTAGTYLVTYTLSSNSATCMLPDSKTFTVVINPEVTPTFPQIAPICQGTPVTAILPTSSNNTTGQITGTWNTAVSNSTLGDTIYTFTPDPGQCATTATMTINVFAPNIIPTFTQIAPICQGATPLSFLNNSNNLSGSISGTWNSAISTSTVGNTIYVFTPNPGQCALPTTMIIEVKANPVFTITGACQGAAYTLEVVLTPPNSNASYAWFNGLNSMNTTTSTVVVNELATYSCKVTIDGCTEEKFITPTDIICQIQKGISPNGDNLNDYFDLSSYDVNQLEIYNRYGTRVYNKSNYKKEWFGQTEGGEILPDGTYYYVINLNVGDTKTGWIYINKQNNN